MFLVINSIYFIFFSVYFSLRFVDNKCPVTCQTCPEFVFAAKTRVFKLDTPPSAFSLHNYDHDESLFSSTMDAGAMVEDVSANSVDVCHDVFDSCDQLKLHGECHNSATHQ